MPKRILTGTVTSDKNEQTITVSVERRFKHPLLQKTVRKSKKYRAHDAENKFKVGDTVSYRVPSLGDFPFAAVIKAVHEDYIEIADCGEPDKCVRATRESRPVVADADALG